MNKNQRKLRIIIVITVLLHFVLHNSGPLWTQFEGLWAAAVILSVYILRVCLIAMVVLMAVGPARHSAWRRRSNYTAAGIAVAYLLFVWLAPRPLLHDEMFRSRVKIVACREGTNSHSVVFFRADGTYDLRDVSFFRNANHKGTYTQKNDTLFLHFIKGEPGLLGGILVVRDSALYRVFADTTVHTYYYLGACKGLN